MKTISVGRDIVETEEISDRYLDGVTARLEQDSVEKTEIEHTGTEAEKILRYKFDEELGNGDSWHGQVDVEIYHGAFQARGDEVLVSDYFAPNRVQELELE